MAKKLLMVNGPNLDMLGIREPEVYGSGTLKDLEQEVTRYALERGADITCYQSNHEGDLIECIHAAHGVYDGIVYNPGAHTHYSYALRDAVGSINVPVVEVHLSEINEREPFRRVSVIAPACVAQVKGLGVASYLRGIDILLDHDVPLPRLGEGFEKRFAPDTPIACDIWPGDEEYPGNFSASDSGDFIVNVSAGRPIVGLDFPDDEEGDSWSDKQEER